MTGQAEELSTEDVLAEVQSDTVFGEEEMRFSVAVITAESSLALLLGGRLGVRCWWCYTRDSSSCLKGGFW